MHASWAPSQRCRADEGERSTVAANMRLGHIPAGSTDAVAYSLNGTRSQQTAALHIAIGDRRGADLIQLHFMHPIRHKTVL